MGTKVMEIVVFGFRSTVHVSTMFRYASVNLAINHRCTTQYLLSMPQTQIYVIFGAHPGLLEEGGQLHIFFPEKPSEIKESLGRYLIIHKSV